MSTGGCRDLHTSDVTSKGFYLYKSFHLIPSSAPPIFVRVRKSNKRAPHEKYFSFRLGRDYLGHGFGKQLVYDLIYTCSGRDFIDEYINPFTRAEKCLKTEMGRRFRNPFNDFLVNMKRKRKKKQNKKKS